MSSANVKGSERMKLAPVRSVNDFLLDSKRYLPPTFNDLKRFNNRVTSNLLYYQTNYFAISGAVFLLALLFNFNRLFAGAFGIASGALTVLFALDRIPLSAAKELRSKYPFAVYGVAAVNILVLYLNFRSILSFLLVVLVPIAFWMLHASMRSRGIKNKVSNKMEQLGAEVYSNTPMGFVLTLLGFDTKTSAED